MESRMKIISPVLADHELSQSQSLPPLLRYLPDYGISQAWKY